MKRSDHSNRNAWAMATVAALLLGGAGVSAMGAESRDDGAAAVSPYDERLRGLVSPSRVVRIGAPLDGEVAEILVKENDAVKAGQPMVRMKADLQENQVAATKIQAELAAAELENASNELERVTKLRETNSIGARELREAELMHRVAEIKVRQAAQAVKQEEDRLSRYTIVAPFDGRVTDVESEVGASLRISEPILTLEKLDVLEATLYLPTELANQLEAGKSYRFMAGDPVNRAITGTMKQTVRRINEASGTFRARFMIDNADESLWAGIAVQLVLGE